MIRPKLTIVAALALGVLVADAGRAPADPTVNVNTKFDETTVVRSAGSGPAGTTIDPQHASPVLDSFGPVQISGVTITGGQAVNGGGGGPGHSGHAGGFGAGVVNAGTLTVTNTTIAGNTAGQAHYRLVVIATTPSGRRSAPAQVTFTLVREVDAPR